MKKSKKQLMLAGTVCLLAFLVSRFFVQVILIHGESMEPAFHSGQLTLIDKWTKEYQYNDVVAFRCEELSAILIKRIVGMPGDTIQITDGILYRNGEAVRLEYGTGSLSYGGLASEGIILGEGEYFVLGDNFERSRDSRYTQVGRVKEASILGIVIW